MGKTVVESRAKNVTLAKEDRCPACERGALEVFFEVTQAPILCNVLCATREAALAVPRGDVRLGFCSSCGHVYNAAFDPKLMQYDGAYENSLQFSPRFRDYIESLASGLVERFDLRGKNIIEIGCGQGDFLSLLCGLGRNRGVGFDPSFDPQKPDTALADGVEILPKVYSPEDADRAVDLLCCRHVLEHIPRPLKFLEQIRRTLGERRDVVLFFEVPNALFTLKRRAIWDIIYEHCSYFTPASLRNAFELAGFEVLAVNEVYDGQFLTIEARPSDPTGIAIQPDDVLVEAVRRFEDEYRTKVAQWRQKLERIKNENRRTVVWGVGSKGVTFLNVLRISHKVMPYAVDLNPRKHGHFISGTGQEIVPPEDLATRYRPDEVIIMNGIYKEEIAQMLCGLGIEAELSAAG